MGINRTFAGFAALGLVALVGCGPEDGLQPEDIQGRYEVTSSFSFPRGLPEGTNPTLDAFIELSKNPEKLGTWTLEVLEKNLDDPYLTLLQSGRKGFNLDAELDQLIATEDPELIARVADFADDIEQLTTALSFRSEIQLTPVKGEQGGDAEHTLVASVFELDGKLYDYDFDRMRISVKRGVTASYRINLDEWIKINRHDFELPYGDIMTFAINEVVAPKIDPTADSLADLTSSLFPCDLIGDYLGEKVGFGPEGVSSGVFASACVAAIDKRAQALNDDFVGIEAHLTLQDGDAVLLDERGDREIDLLDDGQWYGDLEFATGTVRLARPSQTFTGLRMGGSRFED